MKLPLRQLAILFAILLGLMACHEGSLPHVEPETLTLSPIELSLDVGETYLLTTTVTPIDTSFAVTFESSNSAVASVDKRGLVKALTPGVTIVKASVGKLHKECSVTVSAGPNPTKVTLEVQTTSLTIEEGDTKQIQYTVTPADMPIAFSCDNNDVATVDSKGLVTAVAAGSAIVTLLVENQKAMVSVSVTEKPKPTRPKLAIEYLAPYDIDQAGIGFATTHSNDASGLFALWRVEAIMQQDFLKDYHMGTPAEWLGIFPAYTNTRLIDFFRAVDYLGIKEEIEVHGQLGNYTADYRNMGDALTYAIRFKGEGNRLLTAYRYEGIGSFDEGDLISQIRVTVRYLGTDFTGGIDEIATSEYWQQNVGGDIIRIFPCSGYCTYPDDYGQGAPDALTHRGEYGGYLCRPAKGAESTCNVSYGFNTCAVFINDFSGSNYAWQLRPFTND